MATEVTFYVLSEGQAAEEVACTLLIERLQRRQRIAVMASDKQAAEAFDELLWSLPAERFVPHSLVGEGGAGGAPVVIGWDQPLSDYGYQKHLLVNLQAHAPDVAHQFRSVIDFVPADTAGKEQARERYRQYRRQGLTLTTQQLNEPT